MKVFKQMILLVLSMLWVGFASAQGIRVYRADGTSLDLPYNKIDSLVVNDHLGGNLGVHEAIDLGLSVSWATCNVGASSPSGYGDYFAWGETSQKSEYTVENSVTYGKTIGDIAGDSCYDAASANWGSDWRMPTQVEMEELRDSCTWTCTFMNGKLGYRVTGPNNNSIFLPAAGDRYGTSIRNAGVCGYYWCSTPNDIDTRGAYSFYFGKDYRVFGWPFRHCGFSVRPVSE